MFIQELPVYLETVFISVFHPNKVHLFSVFISVSLFDKILHWLGVPYLVPISILLPIWCLLNPDLKDR